MLKYGLLCIVIMSFSSYGQEIQKLHSKEKLIQVFTTAENTDLRLTPTNNLNFIPSQQPVESEISVFVNPTQSFQNFMGIGGAITDASAEVFAKLPKQQQQQFLDAYFTKDKGIGYTLLKGEILNQDQFESLLCAAFTTSLPTNQDDCEIEQKASIDMPVIELINPTVSDTLDTQKTANEPTVLKALHLALERGEIHLKYQQLYDKEDTNLYTYEVTSGFIYGNTWKDISSLKELSEDHELSIKLDRWILVESCKQLHNFITQYPEAKLIVNLNKAVLLNDRTFPEFIAKLITIVRSKLSHPIILQFSEDDISQNIAEAQKYIAQLRQYGAEVSIRDFGNSIYSESILRQLDINNLTLHENLTRMLSSDANTEELQEKVAVYHQLKNIQIMLRDLNDMTSFANAWNVDARFIQGDYFQKKLDHLIDVQDQ